jgi:5-methylcytosine-specific restriction endonuclease McrA
VSGYTKGICICGNRQESKGRDARSGKQKFGRYCGPCRKNKSRKAFLIKEEFKMTCSQCGFLAQHRCQLDIDHIDGNHKNEDMSNLQLLCANCHRLKTYLNEDWTYTPAVYDVQLKVVN